MYSTTIHQHPFYHRLMTPTTPDIVLFLSWRTPYVSGYLKDRRCLVSERKCFSSRFIAAKDDSIMAIIQSLVTLLGVVGGVLSSPTPELTELEPRANTTCTFTGKDGYLQVSQTKSQCSTIILDSLEVPGGVTLNLENLNTGTTVRLSFGFSFLFSTAIQACTNVKNRSSSRAAHSGTTQSGPARLSPSAETRSP